MYVSVSGMDAAPWVQVQRGRMPCLQINLYLFRIIPNNVRTLFGTKNVKISRAADVSASLIRCSQVTFVKPVVDSCIDSIAGCALLKKWSKHCGLIASK